MGRNMANENSSSSMSSADDKSLNDRLDDDESPISKRISVE